MGRRTRMVLVCASAVVVVVGTMTLFGWLVLDAPLQALMTSLGGPLAWVIYLLLPERLQRQVWRDRTGEPKAVLPSRHDVPRRSADRLRGPGDPAQDG